MELSCKIVLLVDLGLAQTGSQVDCLVDHHLDTEMALVDFPVGRRLGRELALAGSLVAHHPGKVSVQVGFPADHHPDSPVDRVQVAAMVFQVAKAFPVLPEPVVGLAFQVLMASLFLVSLLELAAEEVPLSQVLVFDPEQVRVELAEELVLRVLVSELS